MLETIYGKHPNFPHAKEFLLDGVRFFFKREVTEPERQEDLQLMIEYRNQKLAKRNSKAVMKLILKDIEHGFAMPIPTEALVRIPGIVAQPTGAAIQITIDETGKRYKKVRVAHNSSFNFTKDKQSINDQEDIKEYLELIYRYCLPRVLDFIVA